MGNALKYNYKNKCRVLFRYSSHQFDTGSPKSLVAMIGLLEDTIYEPLYLATGVGPLLDVLEKGNIKIFHDNVIELSIKSPWQVISRISYYRKKLRELNVALLHMNEFGWNQDIVLAAWTLKIPVILHCHNPVKISSLNFNRFAAKKVLTVSEMQLSQIEGASLVKGKSDYLYNTLNISGYAEGTSIRESLGYTNNEILIGTVAQISHRKGTDVLIETSKLLIPKYDQLRFILVGPPGKGESELLAKISSDIKDSGLNGKVKILGSRTDIPDLLATFDIFFLPTRAEPFGMVIIEALAAGLPVVASRVGGIPEIINSNKLGRLVDDIKPEIFSEVIDSILKLEDRGASLGKAGQKSLIGRFDEDTIRKKLVSIYNSLIN